MYMFGNKSHVIKIHDKTIDMKETKDLYGRLLVLTRSSRDVDQKEVVGNSEFTLTPRALFATSGSLLPCSDKSKLIQVLTKLATEETAQGATGDIGGNIEIIEADNFQHITNVAVVDGIVVVQKLTKKSTTMVTVRDLSECFYDRPMNLTPLMR